MYDFWIYIESSPSLVGDLFRDFLVIGWCRLLLAEFHQNGLSPARGGNLYGFTCRFTRNTRVNLIKEDGSHYTSTFSILAKIWVWLRSPSLERYSRACNTAQKPSLEWARKQETGNTKLKLNKPQYIIWKTRKKSK